MSGVLPTNNGLLIPPIETPNNTLDDGSGNVSVNGNVTISGAGGVLTINNTQDTTSLIINGNTTLGGKNQPASILLNNQASTIAGGNKFYFRADSDDNFQILNNSYSTALLTVSQSGMVHSAENTLDDGSGNATIAGALSVEGAQSGSTLNLSSGATVGGALSVTGAQSGSTLDLSGNATVGGALSVTGALSVNGYLIQGTISTIAALRSATTASLTQSTVYVQGYSSVCDGGEGIFIDVSSDTTSSDNGGTIIVDASGRRWHRERASASPLRAEWFGALPNGNDFVAPLADALSALGSQGGIIEFGHGTFTGASELTFAFPATDYFSLTLRGAGAEATILKWSTSNGISMSLQVAEQSCHIQDLTFAIASAGTYNGLTLTNATLEGTFYASSVERTVFRGADGGQATDYWNIGIDCSEVSALTVIDSVFYGPSGADGTGIQAAGNASVSPYYEIVLNVRGCDFFNCAIGFVYGTYLQGVAIEQCNFTNGTTGILVPAGNVGNAQLTVTGSQFNTAANQIVIESPLASLIASSNLLYISANNSGILFSSSINQNTIIGNVFTGLSTTGSTGIATNSGSSTSTIVASNIFYNLEYGINLAYASNWVVGINSFSTVTNPIINPLGGGGNILSAPFPTVITLGTNPPVSGTAYQWTGPGTLQLACPITLNPTTTAAATAALNIGPTSSLGNQMDYSSRPAGLTAADGEIETLKAQIPAGWYYGLTVVNATIGTCVAIAS